MSNKVYVGNLPYSFTNDDLRNLFAAYGAVRLAEVILDRMTNRSRGFGFVEMDTPDGVQQVIRSLHDTELQGRRLTVNEARDRVAGSGGGGGPRFDAGARAGGGGFATPRASGGSGGGGAGHNGSRAAGNGWSGGSGAGPSWSTGRGGPQRGGGRPKRDAGDRWSDGGGRRRRPNDDFGDE